MDYSQYFPPIKPRFLTDKEKEQSDEVQKRLHVYGVEIPRPTLGVSSMNVVVGDIPEEETN